LINRKTLKLVAIGYAVKTVAFAIAWMIVPDLPQRAMDTARQAWVWAGGSATPAAPPAPATTARSVAQP
jgi:hypothetical protein